MFEDLLIAFENLEEQDHKKRGKQPLCFSLFTPRLVCATYSEIVTGCLENKDP